MNKYSLILAGGAGKRLWPLSREKWPKYMLKFNSDDSLLQMAYKRVAGIIPENNRFIVAAKEVDFLIEREIKRTNKDFNKESVILEPCARNTAPAIMLGINKLNEDDIVVVLPADHVINPEEKFKKSIENAIEIASEDYIVSIGIKPAYPATGYGYIKCSEKTIGQGHVIEEFKEKPDLETAKKYRESGNYFWNAGIFVFKAGIMKEEIRKYNKEIDEIFDELTDDQSNIDSIYSKMPNISIDYAVMEKTDRAAVVSFEGDYARLV